MDWASLTVTALTVYAVIGLVFAVVFVARGAGKVDPAAAGSPLGFKLLVLPGVAAVWPLLALRWLRGAPPPAERNAHRCAAGDAT